jgi:hypothetical protein
MFTILLLHISGESYENREVTNKIIFISSGTSDFEYD